MDCWYELVEDVIFANSFFALEETGLAYPSLSSADDDESKAMDAWLRVFASGNRVQEGKFFERNNLRSGIARSAFPIATAFGASRTRCSGLHGAPDF